MLAGKKSEGNDHGCYLIVMVVRASQLAFRSQKFKGSERFRAQRPSCLYGSLFRLFYRFFYDGAFRVCAAREHKVTFYWYNSSPECQ